MMGMHRLCLRLALLTPLLGACGGTGGPNQVAVTVDSGPAASGTLYINGPFVSVTLCVPGTSQCQTIPEVLVDTGSMGLRMLSSAAGGALTLALPQESDVSGAAYVECSPFLDGFTWGPVRTADFKIGGEEARSLPLQVIGDPSFLAIPQACSNMGGTAMMNQSSVAVLGANGILGVGAFPQDCGEGCTESLTAPNTNNPGVYFGCSAGTCTATSIAVARQVQNPISLFPTDNNGMSLEFPTVPSSGAPQLSGTLTFGIGTQANNVLGSAVVLPIDANTLTLTTEYQGTSYPNSFVDSGSNAYYFLDTATSGLPTCAGTDTMDFYCPTTSSTVSFTATNKGLNGATSAVTFSVANADTLYGEQSNIVFGDLAGPSISGSGMAMSQYFDFGLPFFFGRKVFTAIEESSAPGGATPYVAY